MNQLAPLVAPTRHAHGTVTTHKSQMARGTAAPREHPTSTHTAPSWLLDDTLPETGLAFCTPAPWRLSPNTTAARWQRLCGTFVAPHLDAKATKNTCPQRQSPPFFVLVEEAQRMGPLGQIAGEIGHGGSWGQSRAFLRPKRRLLLRPLAALPPRAVLWPETMALPWHQPSHAELRIPQIVRIYPSIASDSQESTQS